jgi:hypothetical protein
MKYQLCPRCLGTGKLSRPPDLPLDQPYTIKTNEFFKCNICNGLGYMTYCEIEYKPYQPYQPYNPWIFPYNPNDWTYPPNTWITCDKPVMIY